MMNEFFLNIKRAFMVIGFIVLLMALLVVADRSDVVPQSSGTAQGERGTQEPAPLVALISGHAGHDSGAICKDADGEITLQESRVVAAIADLTAVLLREDGFDVIVLDEYDPRLDGLEAAVLLSLHADSCLPASGYKAAYYTHSRTPISDERLVGCVHTHYASETGLVSDPNTITEDMTEYHAFRKLDQGTPAAILELGFLGGDSELLTETPEIPAQGVVKSLHCFIDDSENQE